jgi:iron(III) transport system substrate-binding protein
MGKQIKHAILAGLAAFVLAACGGETEGTDANTAWEITGPDRLERLIAGAREEGELSFYTSLPVATTSQITEAFTAKYGIPVNMYRAESTQLLQRAVNEARAGRHTVDVVETAAAEVEAMEREQLFRPVNLPVLDNLVEGATVPGRAWIATRFTLFAVAYNTNIVSPADAPQRFEDLRDPKWRGMIGIEGENANWLMEVSGILGRDETVALFEEIRDTNGMSFRRGHTLLVNLVASGEVPIGINAYHEHVEHAQEGGAPVDYAVMEPAIAMPLSAAAFRNAPHPHAAILFMDFLLTEGQQFAVDQHMIPANTEYQASVNAPPFKMLDVAKYVDEHDEWFTLYQQLFSGR